MPDVVQKELFVQVFPAPVLMSAASTKKFWHARFLEKTLSCDPKKAKKPIPPFRNSVAAALLAATAAIVLLIGPGSASANNDPHRIYLPTVPFDLPGSYCGFPVHLEPAVNKEYATVSQAADGSTLYKITGSLFLGATNAATGKTITLNVSGPGTLTISPDGTIFAFDGQGLALLYAANLTQLGFPSDVVVTSGRFLLSIDATTSTVVSLEKEAHALLDVCAALSP